MDGAVTLQGFEMYGPINPEPEDEEPIFHEEWQKLLFGSQVALVFMLSQPNNPLGVEFSMDGLRYARERQPPVEYTSRSYYEGWLAGQLKALYELGIASKEELIATGLVSETAGDDVFMTTAELDLAKELRDKALQQESVVSPDSGPLLYEVGDPVRAILQRPAGHTRLPPYLRGRVGVIEGVWPAEPYPDLGYKGFADESKNGYLYSVRFQGSDIWGPHAEPNSEVYITLWQDYLEPA